MEAHRLNWLECSSVTHPTATTAQTATWVATLPAAKATTDTTIVMPAATVGPAARTITVRTPLPMPLLSPPPTPHS
ncbi:hypothetical protein V9T40_013984 [Parthenolecanium corni]|uniref:Uncharacterized protein n=1 Tax=Parthenolecanium corni TaxID=536013 RepID=A0AAN9TT36_9HEMI